MDSLSKKTLTTSRSLTYTYYHHPGDSNKPTVLLMHGFPDNARLWSGVLTYLVPTGYPLLIPDMLGHDGTSKPTDLSQYNSKSIATDLIELCDKENARSIVAIGHDWGSFMATRLHGWYPDRTVGVGLLNLAYFPPDQEHPFDLQAILKMQEEAFGDPLYAYWELFEAPDAEKLIDSRLESFYTVLHGEDSKLTKKLWCTRGAMREFLEADKRAPLKAYAQDTAVKQEFLSRLQRNGISGPLQWWRAEGAHSEVEKDMDPKNFTMNKPVLFLGCTDDPVCLPSMIGIASEKGLLPNLTVKEVASAHWCLLEKPQEVGTIVATFLKDNAF